MNLLYQEILFQKLKTRPNRKFIRRLQNLVDKKRELTFKEFVDFGRYIPRENFVVNYNIINESLHPDCTYIIVYLGGLYIQALKDNTFYVKTEEGDFNSEELLRVEKYYWINKVREIAGYHSLNKEI